MLAPRVDAVGVLQHFHGREALDEVLDHANVVRRFRALLEKAGLPTLRRYDLRHTYATHMLVAGAYVAAQLGHAKPTMTLSTYAHWLPTTDGRRFVHALELHRAGGA